MMRLTLFLAALGVVAVVSPTRADGYIPAHRSTACCDVDWSGAYGRASIAYNFGNIDLGSSRTEGGVVVGALSDSASPDGVQGVLTIGYDHAVGSNFAVGVFGDYAFGDHDDNASLFDPGLPGATESVSLEINDTWSVGGRVGYTGHCCAMFYLAAGYSRSRIEFSDPDTPVFADGFGDESRRLNGYFLGAGVDYSLMHGLFLNFEYRFTDYGSQNLVDVDFTCGGVPCNVAIDSDDIQVHALRLGLAYKFDFDRPVSAPLK